MGRYGGRGIKDEAQCSLRPGINPEIETERSRFAIWDIVRVKDPEIFQAEGEREWCPDEATHIWGPGKTQGFRAERASPAQRQQTNHKRD